MAIKKIRIKIEGERGSGRSQLLNKIKTLLQSDPQVIEVVELEPSELRPDLHQLLLKYDASLIPAKEIKE